MSLLIVVTIRKLDIKNAPPKLDFLSNFGGALDVLLIYS